LIEQGKRLGRSGGRAAQSEESEAQGRAPSGGTGLNSNRGED